MTTNHTIPMCQTRLIETTDLLNKHIIDKVHKVPKNVKHVCKRRLQQGSFNQKRRVRFSCTSQCKGKVKDNAIDNCDDGCYDGGKSIKDLREKSQRWYTVTEYQSIMEELRLTINAFRIFEARLLVEIAKNGDTFNYKDNALSIASIGKLFEKELEKCTTLLNNQNDDTTNDQSYNVGSLLSIRGLEKRLEHRTIRDEIQVRNFTMRKIVVKNSKLHIQQRKQQRQNETEAREDALIIKDQELVYDHESIKKFYEEACIPSRLEAIRQAQEDAIEALNIYRCS